MPTAHRILITQISQSALKLVENRYNISIKLLYSYAIKERKQQNSNEVFPAIMLKQLFQQIENPMRNTQMIAVLKALGTLSNV